MKGIKIKDKYSAREKIILNTLKNAQKLFGLCDVVDGITDTYNGSYGALKVKVPHIL